jgi:hypothetical protein
MITLIMLDRVFANAEWDQAFDSHVLHDLSSSLLDHCPLLLSNQSAHNIQALLDLRISRLCF